MIGFQEILFILVVGGGGLTLTIDGLYALVRFIKWAAR
jgi:hypothetical protein